MSENCQGMKIIAVEKDKIEEIDKEDVHKMETFKGTLKVHQLTWSEDNKNVLQARRLTCLECLPNETCKHYNVGAINVSAATTEISSKQTSEPKKQRKQLHYKDVYTSSSDEMSDEEKDVPVLGQKDIGIGDWVAVIYDDMWYPGIIEQKMGESVEINFMKRNGPVLHWPSTPDKQKVAIHTILCKIVEPPLPISSRQFKLPDQQYKRIDQTFNHVL